MFAKRPTTTLIWLSVWGKLWVKLQTHSAGGITDKDFALAKKIEEVVMWRPQPGDALTGTTNKFVKGG